MNRIRRTYPPSHGLTLLFLAMLAPACCWGVVLLAVSLLSLLTVGADLYQTVLMVCALALLLPVPFVARGKRAAMLPVVFSLLGTLFFSLNTGYFVRLPTAAVLGLFGVGGVYCVGLTHLFRRARPLLETMDQGRVTALCVLCVAAIAELYQGFVLSAAAPPSVETLGELSMLVSFVVLAGALPGLLRPRLSMAAACLGLAHALAGAGTTLWEVYRYRNAPDLHQDVPYLALFAEQRWTEALAASLLPAALFALALWLLRRLERRSAD